MAVTEDLLSKLIPKITQIRHSQQPLAASELLLQVWGSITLKQNMVAFSIMVKLKKTAQLKLDPGRL